MKSCPTCNRTFEDTFTFCLIDGSILGAPFDPQSVRAPQVDRGTPPPTEVISADANSFPGAKPKALQSTIAAPFVQQPLQPQQPFSPAMTGEPQPALDVVRWMFIVRGIATILVGILLIVWGGGRL